MFVIVVDKGLSDTVGLIVGQRRWNHQHTTMRQACPLVFEREPVEVGIVTRDKAPALLDCKL
jgi:hypothetical protein